MDQQSTFLVLGATGGTGKHFVAKALKDGHRVGALVRNPAKLPPRTANREVYQGSIIDVTDTDHLMGGIDFVISMLGDVSLKKCQNQYGVCEEVGAIHAATRGKALASMTENR